MSGQALELIIVYFFLLSARLSTLITFNRIKRLKDYLCCIIDGAHTHIKNSHMNINEYSYSLLAADWDHPLRHSRMSELRGAHSLKINANILQTIST